MKNKKIIIILVLILFLTKDIFALAISSNVQSNSNSLYKIFFKKSYNIRKYLKEKYEEDTNILKSKPIDIPDVEIIEDANNFSIDLESSDEEVLFDREYYDRDFFENAPEDLLLFGIDVIEYSYFKYNPYYLKKIENREILNIDKYFAQLEIKEIVAHLGHKKEKGVYDEFINTILNTKVELVSGLVTPGIYIPSENKIQLNFMLFDEDCHFATFILLHEFLRAHCHRLNIEYTDIALANKEIELYKKIYKHKDDNLVRLKRAIDYLYKDKILISEYKDKIFRYDDVLDFYGSEYFNKSVKEYVKIAKNA
jgi:hypothetical protein